MIPNLPFYPSCGIFILDSPGNSYENSYSQIKSIFPHKGILICFVSFERIFILVMYCKISIEVNILKIWQEGEGGYFWQLKAL